MKEVLFVCTGNTCRSPMAEVIARDVHKDLDIKFVSRGVNVLMPARASSDAVRAVRQEYDLDLSNHLARALTEADLRRADLTLTMTDAHKYYILQAYPAYADKCFTLCEYAGVTGGNVKDPYGLDAAVYRACANELRAYIEGLDLGKL